jgi:ferricrocin synthase
MAAPASDKMSPYGKTESLSIVNPNPIKLPGPGRLHELVSESSSSASPAIDYIGDDGSQVCLSYEQLHASSSRLREKITANLTHKSKDQTNVAIPLLIPQSPALYVGILAILKAGAAFCPLNLDAPQDRISFIVKDVQARLVLTVQEHASRFEHIPSLQVLILDEDDLSDVSNGGTSHAKSTTTETNDLAYIMYTSGSTGTPKGVGVSHEAATQSLLAHDRHLPAFRRFLQFAAPTFDVSVFEIFFPLFRGSTLVSCSRRKMLDDLPAVLREMEVDACELTPTVAGSLLRFRRNAPGLQLLLTIGEMLTEPVVTEFGGNDDENSILWAMYGPTEAAIHWYE